jgi:hypothetical protein
MLISRRKFFLDVAIWECESSGGRFSDDFMEKHPHF